MSSDTKIVGLVQWGTKEDPFSAQPALVQNLLSSKGIFYGYGYGNGWSVIFDYENGEISLLPGQWIAKMSDGTFKVFDDDPRKDLSNNSLNK